MADKDFSGIKPKNNFGLLFSVLFFIQAILFALIAFFALPSQTSLFTILVAITFALIFGVSVALFATMAEVLIFLIIFAMVKQVHEGE